MKERDIVDFDKMKKDPNNEMTLIDADGKHVGCTICYTHEKAKEILDNKQFIFDDGVTASWEFEDLDYFHPLCPECGQPLIGGVNHGYAPSGFVTVSEGNFSNPDGEIYYCQAWHCENDKCPSQNHQGLFATMPVPIVWNANHDIHYTGGKTYLEEGEHAKFLNLLFEKMKPSIEQYVRRKLNPEDAVDRSLDINNVLYWCKNDVEEAFATWLYEHGLKK